MSWLPELPLGLQGQKINFWVLCVRVNIKLKTTSIIENVTSSASAPYVKC